MQPRHGDSKAAEVLIRNGADVDAKDIDGHAPIWTAANNSQVDVVRLLLDEGADFGKNDSSDDTPLRAAVQNGAMDIVRELLARGTDISTLGHGDQRQTFLRAALEEGDAGMVQVLIDHGADVHEVFENGHNILHCVAESEACQRGSAAVVDVLIKNGAAVNVENDLGYTPLLLATLKGHVFTISALLRHGAKLPAELALLRRDT